MAYKRSIVFRSLPHAQVKHLAVSPTKLNRCLTLKRALV